MASDTIRLTKRDFSLLMNLYRTQSWLVSREDALYSLFRLCPDEETVSLVASLLQHFHMFSTDEYLGAIDALATHLVEAVHITPTNSLLVASCIDDNPDGSQQVLLQLRNCLSKRGLGTFRLINRYGKGLAALEPNMWFIVVDDFTGSGKTMRARKKSFDEKCRTACIEAKFYACSVAAMSSAVKCLQESGISFWTPKEHDKGIPQVFPETDQSAAYERMKHLETLINDGSDPDVYPFGYGQAEAIVALGEAHNTPNSVYPIFWAPTHADGSARGTILCRG